MRSLTESKKLLDEARLELQENKERAQLRPKHTFSRLPGFFPRKAEMQVIERALEGEPSFTVLFGASSVGKVSIVLPPLYSYSLMTVFSRQDRTPPRGPFIRKVPRVALRFANRRVCGPFESVHKFEPTNGTVLRGNRKQNGRVR